MPEGHTIHRHALDLGALLAGRRVRATSPQGRFAAGAALIDGALLAGAEAHGKHLFLGFGDRPHWLHVHLGLAGTWRHGLAEAGLLPQPRPAARLWLTADVTDTAGPVPAAGRTAYADLTGPAACQLLDPGERSAITARLGPDPLRPDFDPETVWTRVQASSRPIAALLLDQAVIAGVGNVYRAEALFRQRIHPFRPGRSLPRETWDRLVNDLVTLLGVGVATNRIITTEPEHRPDPDPAAVPSRVDGFYLYERVGEPCRICGTPVHAEPFHGRRLYWCPGCQPG